MSERTRIKLCGMTRREDVELAAELGADFVGFVMWERSPRAIAPEVLASWPRRRDDEPLRVGVFVDAPVDTLRRAVDRGGLDLVQLHGDEPPELVRQLPVPCIRAVRMASPEVADAFRDHPARYLLLDTHVAGTPGGTGRTFRWDWARRVERPFFLAGGLGPDNVAEAARIARPFAVDLSSQLEQSPGVKDPDRMRRVFRALRESPT